MASSLFLVSCAASGRYAYFPEENPESLLSGRTEVSYDIPVSSPQGSVRLVMRGIVTLPPADGRRLRAIEVRMVIANRNGDGEWRVDTRDQSCSLDMDWHTPPIAVSVTAPERPPVVTIEPRTTSTIEFLFPLPPLLDDAAEIPQFEVTWRLRTSRAIFSDRAAFLRRHFAPAPPDVYSTLLK